MADKVDLSIVIVNCNTKALLSQCLKSLMSNVKWPAAQDSFGMQMSNEIIVVDNGSNDDSVEMVKKEFSQVKLIKNKENLGFAKANNQGIRQARGKYILFLNPDTIILDKALLKMVEWLKTRPRAGILGCQILDEKKKVHSSGGFFPNLWRVFLWMSGIDHFLPVARIFGAYHLPRSFFSTQRELDWVQGCALMARKEVITKISGFDENFFMYTEEIDLCLRAKKAGWQVWFTPKAQIIHLGGGKTTRPILGEYKSLLYFFKKHFTFWHFSVLKFLLRLGAILRMGFFGIIRKDEKLKEIYFQAFQLAR